MNTRTVTATELKRRTGAVLESVISSNANIIITKESRPYVMIVPLNTNELLNRRLLAEKKYLGSAKGLEKAVKKIRSRMNNDFEKLNSFDIH